jgi:hypothetical protein
LCVQAHYWADVIIDGHHKFGERDIYNFCELKTYANAKDGGWLSEHKVQLSDAWKSLSSLGVLI